MDTATIKARKSVRTFTDQPVAPETIAELERFIASDANPLRSARHLPHPRPGARGLTTAPRGKIRNGRTDL